MRFQFLGLSSPGPLKREPPDHPFPLVIKHIFSVGYPPKSGKFPAADGEFVEQRYGEHCFDGIEQRSVCRVELLVAATARACVVDDVSAITVKIGIARIDPAKVGQQRYQSAIALVDAVTDLVKVGNIIPREDVFGVQPVDFHSMNFTAGLKKKNIRIDRPVILTKMIRHIIGKLWKILPRSLRRLTVRLSQTNFTVSVAAIVVNDKREVLLLNHVLRPRSGWGFPGGFLDADEPAADAIKREIREETGIDLEHLSFMRALVHGNHVEIVFAAKPVGEPQVLSSEIYELGWFGTDSLPDGTTLGQKMLIGEVLATKFDNRTVEN